MRGLPQGRNGEVPGLAVIIKCFEKFGVLPTPVPFSDFHTAHVALMLAPQLSLFLPQPMQGR
jgi:hypothetical protein